MKKLAYVVICVVVAGCAQPPTKYRADDQQIVSSGAKLDKPAEQKATIEFTTNTSERATFERLAGGQLCSRAESKTMARVQRAREISEGEGALITASNVLSLGIGLLFDPRNNKPPHVLTQEVEAGQALVLEASSYGNTGNSTVSCGPLFLKFQPEGSKKYRVSFIRDADRCLLGVRDVSVLNQPAPVKHSRWSCSKGFLGLGGGEVTGLREYSE